MTRRARRKLTEAQWRTVFDLRCRAKRGEYIRPEDQKLLEMAYHDDADRYRGLDGEVFDATKPFGAK